MQVYAVIMAGGIGTRLWPISRRDNPKQIVNILGETSLYQNTLKRIEPLIRAENIIVVAGEELLPKLMVQSPNIPHNNYIIEPEGRGTAPCIGLAGVHIMSRHSDSIMIVLPSDHYISNIKSFYETIRFAVEAASEGHLVTFGIKPTNPSTAYGYIKQGEIIHSMEKYYIYKVEKFTEKPDENNASMMIEDGRYSWNSGIFIWKTSRIMEEFHKHMPELYNQLIKISHYINKPFYNSNLRKHWSLLPRETIDYGIMEKAEDVVIIPLNIGWSDVGSWASLMPLLNKDEEGNVVKGNILTLDTHDSLILGERRLIASIGISDLIIVDTENALLICRQSEDQRVKEIVNILTQEKKSEYL